MKTKSLQQSIERVFFFLSHQVDTDQRSDLALHYFPMVFNSKLYVKINVCGVKNFIILLLLKTNYLDLWLQALQETEIYYEKLMIREMSRYLENQGTDAEVFKWMVNTQCKMFWL